MADCTSTVFRYAPVLSSMQGSYSALQPAAMLESGKSASPTVDTMARWAALVLAWRARRSNPKRPRLSLAPPLHTSQYAQ